MFKIISKLIRKIKNIFKHRCIHENILDKYYKLDKDVFCTSKQQAIFNNAMIGDLIFSTMPLNIEDLKKVPVGHQQRPYYIAYKLNNGFIAFYSTSNRINKNSLNYYVIDNSKYSKTNKYTYIDLTRIEYIPKNNIQFKMFSLNKNDKNEINRRLYASKKGKYLELYKEPPKVYAAKVGDIFTYDKSLWLVVNEDNDKYETINVSINDQICSGYIFKCGKREYVVHQDIQRNILKQPSIIPCDIMDKTEFSKLLKLIKENRIDYESLKQGCMFESDNKLYYCINKNEHNASAYRIHSIDENIDISSFVRVRHNDETYFIDKSKQYTIPCSTTLKVLFVLDIDNINLVKQNISYKKKKKINKEDRYYLRLKVGTILTNDRQEDYVYMYSNDECDYAVSVFEYENNDLFQNYSLYSLGKDKTVVIGEADNDVLSDILYEQISKGRDKNKILNNTYKEINNNCLM